MASLFFYAYGELEYSLLIVLSIAINYGFGLWIQSSKPSVRQWLLSSGIALNLALLAVFKYANFFVNNLNGLLETLSISPLEIPDIKLPLGISFFTFQAISYLIDVWRKDVEAERDPILLASYISMFPQLIAGPIVRFKTVAEEFHRPYRDLGLYINIHYAYKIFYDIGIGASLWASYCKNYFAFAAFRSAASLITDSVTLAGQGW